MTTGIYQVISPSGRIYIGQSTDIERRFAGYQRYSGCCKQRRLYNSLKKYGASTHSYRVIEICPSESLNERERYWQEHHDSLGKQGLNCRYVTTQDKTGSPSPASRARMSLAQSGTNNPNYGRYGTDNPLFGRQRPAHVIAKIAAYQATRGRLVEQITKSGVLVKAGRIRDFVADGFNNGNISSCLSGRLKTTGGFVFRYAHQRPAP